MTPQRRPLAAIGTRIARWRLRSTARIADPIRAGHHREMWIEFYEDSLVTPAPRRSEPAIADARFILILAVAAEDLQWFPEVPFTRLHVKDTSQAVDAIRQGHARLAAVDGDLPDFDVPAICEAARRSGGTAVLVTISAPNDAPKVLKAGCHGILLKPYARNLLAARMGRLSREMPLTEAASRVADRLGRVGTTCKCPEFPCPLCERTTVVSFEHSSHRRDWYACLS